ncbi:unnamed protein product, partial [marine sediment metagenome]
PVPAGIGIFQDVIEKFRTWHVTMGNHEYFRDIGSDKPAVIEIVGIIGV